VNPFFIALFAASQLLYRDIPERSGYFGQMICSKSRCHEFYADNGKLELYFTGIKYYYKKKRSTVKIFCRLWNKSVDTIFMERQSFSISSGSNTYLLQPAVEWVRGMPKELPDKFGIIPWMPGQEQLIYSFEFTSKDKMLRKLMGSDTLSFQYSGGGQKSTIFRMVAVLMIDPTWTREDIMRAFTY
jgi:hypothetical protein